MIYKMRSNPQSWARLVVDRKEEVSSVRRIEGVVVKVFMRLGYANISPRRPAYCPGPRRHDLDQASYLVLSTAPFSALDSALLHSGSCYRHTYHSCGCGLKYTTFVGCRTTEHPSPKTLRYRETVTSTPSLPGCKSPFSQLGLLCLSVCLRVLAPVH